MTKRMPIEERKIAIDFRSLPDGMRQCGRCRNVKHMSDFHKDKTRASGVRSACKDCINTRNREMMMDKTSSHYKSRQNHYKNNKESISESRKKWKKKNTKLLALMESRRRARKRKLPDTLTLEEVNEVITIFMDSCAICGGNFEHLDHFIPIATECGGTTKENTVPMCSDCNTSKGAKNPFVWAETLEDYKRERFYYLVKYLSRINGIAMVKDYEAHVTNCFK